MYQPYPGRDTELPETQLPQAQRPPAPASERIAAGVIAAVVWVVLARSCQRGRGWARITGTVLFALATVDTAVGLTTPIAVAVRLWAVVTWLAGLAAVVFLWRRTSSAYFRPRA